jgi:LysM repeat protein
MKALANMTIPCAVPCIPLESRPDAVPVGTVARQSSLARDPVAPTGGCGSYNAGRGSRALTGALVAGALAAAAVGPARAERFPITPEQRETAEKVASTGVPISDLAPNAPSSYTIKRGDTLWSIATLYLKSPWRWPELWGMNRVQIRNPHLIYPGQTLVLVKTAEGRAQLVLGGTPAAGEPAAGGGPARGPAPPPPPGRAPPGDPAGGAAAAAAAPAPTLAVPTVRLSPRARELGSGTVTAIPSIPNNQIEPFLSQPLIVAATDLERFPRIVATQQDRVFLGVGDTAYARGVTDPQVDTYHVFRPARPLYDPDDFDRRSPIAYEALFLGTASVTRRGEVTTLVIKESRQEIGVEDRLIPIDHQELINYVPRRPEKDVAGRIISIYSGVESAGNGSVVTLNRGTRDGLEIGSVLAVLHDGNTIVDRTAAGHETVKLPDETIGNVFVFRVFDGISYALLVSATGAIQVGDRVAMPDAAPTGGALAASGSAH